MKSYKYIFSISLLFSIMISGCGATPQEIAVKTTFKKKLEVMTQQAMTGDKKIQDELCKEYFYTKIGEERTNTEEAMRWCLPGAREGNAWDEYRVGWMLANRFRQDYTYYPEYQSVNGHKGRHEFAIYWLRRSVQHGCSAGKTLLDEEEAWYQKEYNTPNDDMFAKIAVAAAGVAILGGTSNSLSSADKLRMSTGYVSDVMTDGKGCGIQSAAQDIRNEKANTKQETVKVNTTLPRQHSDNSQLNVNSNSIATSKVNTNLNESSSNFQTSGGAVSSEKRYNYIVDSSYAGTGYTESEGCKVATEGGPRKVDIKRIISTGNCNCEKIQRMGLPTYYECTIPYKAEISSPYDPNSKPSGPTKGISR
jgi:hypothetical protein